MVENDVKSSFWMNICGSILFSIFGGYLLFKPYTTTTFLSRFLGVILILTGVFALFKYLTREDKNKKLTGSLVGCIISFIVSIVLFANPTLIGNVFQVFFGVIMVVYPLIKLKYSGELHRIRNNNFGLSLFILIIMFVLGIILLVNPTSSVFSINQIIGTLVIYYCILNVISSYLYKNEIRDLSYEIIDKPGEKPKQKKSRRYLCYKIFYL